MNTFYKFKIFLFFSLVSICFPAFAQLTTFISGDPISSTDVNGNFTYLDGLITTNATAIATNATDIANLDAYVTGLSHPWTETGSVVYYNLGNVGIGTASPASTLDVVGNINASGTVTQASDRRYKKDISVLGASLENVLKLNGVSYEWKNPKKHNEGKHLGVIAQDVEKVYPEAVHTRKDGYKSVSYSSLIAPLIEAIKELNYLIVGNEDKLLVLEAENRAMKSYLCSKDPKAPFCL